MSRITEIPSKLGIGSTAKVLSLFKRFPVQLMLPLVLVLCWKTTSAEATQTPETVPRSIMAPRKIGTLKPEDRAAFLQVANNLGFKDPYELGALVHLESGFDPNVIGGAGRKYRGLIQFGEGARQEVGLPSGPMTIAQQMPYVQKYFEQRGFKPGMDIVQGYATVLGGNPKANIYSKDAFGTSVASAVPRMKKGGDLYKRAVATLGDIDPIVPIPSGDAQQETNDRFFTLLKNRSAQVDPYDHLGDFILRQRAQQRLPQVQSLIDPIALLKTAFSSVPTFIEDV